MDDGDRAAPVALAREQPVAHAVVDLALADAALFEQAGDLVLGRLDGEPVEELRVDHGAFAHVGLVGDGEGRGIGSWRQHHGHHRTPIFAGEIEVALVVAGTAEDGAGAVAHDDEVGDVDRQLHVRLERMDGHDAGVEAALLGLRQRLLGGADLAALLDEFSELLVLLRRQMDASGCSGEIAMNEAPNIVSWRVVNTSSVCSFLGSLAPSSAKRMFAPVDLPIQFLCWVHTKSGHVACRPSSACSSSSA